MRGRHSISGRTGVALSVLLAAVLSLSSCLREMFTMRPVDNDNSLRIATRLFDSGTNSIHGRTKAVLDDDNPSIAAGDSVNARNTLRENSITSLDVFIKRQDAADNAPWFKEYHVRASDASIIKDPLDNSSMQNEVEQLLSRNWTSDGFVPGELYDIYITANNDSTAAGSPAKPASLTALKALKTYEPTIFRYYLDEPVVAAQQSHTRSKKFLMDASIKGWSLDMSESRQLIEVDSLKRAASKIIINVRFSDREVVEMGNEAGDSVLVGGILRKRSELAPGTEIDRGSIKDYLAYIRRAPGLPAWKYVNFGFRTADIEGGTFSLSGAELADKGDGITAPNNLQTYGSIFTAIKNEPEVVPNIDGSYTITTYAYPSDWSTDRDSAPYVLLSFMYASIDDVNDYKFNYYRIPVCNESLVTSLERNKIYIVDAEIASMGSSNSSLELPDEQMRIEYHVIDWSETDMSQEATLVKIKDIKYLTITPTTYTLKGDGEQATTLLWYASVSPDDGRILDINSASVDSLSITHSNGVNIRGTVTKTPANPDGTEDIVVRSVAPTGSGLASGEVTEIRIMPGGFIMVTSEALRSRAVKNIHFVIKLTTTGFSQAVTIRHFPMDNIQSIAGSWSSRNKHTLVKANDDYNEGSPLPEWGMDFVVENRNDVVTREVYNSLAATDRTTTQDDNASLTNAEKNGAFGSTNNNECYNTGATSLANARYYNGWYYWVTRSYSWGGYTYTFHRIQYYQITKLYYEGVPGGRLWVDYSADLDQNFQLADLYRTADDHFIAKVFNTSDSKIYPIEPYVYSGSNHRYRRATSQTSYNVYREGANALATSNSSMASLANNKMYVLQIASTSEEYVVGRPVIDIAYQSQDKVVSPSFMIASQLGANTPFTSATDAAEMCGTYIEVAQNGTRYTGWRLPTRDEVGFIIRYQNDEHIKGVNMQPVLTGEYYWTLEGRAVASGYDANDNLKTNWSILYKDPANDMTNTGNVRCIRDLSTAEVDALNAN